MSDTFIDLNKYRDRKGYIDLVNAYEDLHSTAKGDVLSYLIGIMRIQPIKSRQVAAIAITTAQLMSPGG